MKGTFVIAWREIWERRVLLLVALLLGALPPLGALVSMYPREDAGYPLLVLLAGYGAIVAVLLGPALLGRELAEGRLGFYFARPVSGWAIWGGKVLGGLGVLAFLQLLMLLPHLLLHLPLPFRPFLLLAVSLPYLLLSVGNLAALLARSGSRWLLLDLVLLLAVLPGWYSLSKELVRLEWMGAFRIAVEEPGPALLLFVLPLTLAFLVPSGAAIILGRSDPDRAHRALSLALWPLLLCHMAIVHVHMQRVVLARPADLMDVEWIWPAGKRIALAGRHRERPTYLLFFLWDPATGEFSQFLATSEHLTFSLDGTRAAWLEHSGWPEQSRYQLFTSRLDRSAEWPRAAPIGLPGVMDELALSPDGSLLALDSSGELLVYELSSGRLVNSAQVGRSSWSHGIAFVSPRRVRIYGNEPDSEGGWKTTVRELDLDTNKLARITTLAQPYWEIPSPATSENSAEFAALSIEEGSLVRTNPQTLERKIIISGTIPGAARPEKPIRKRSPKATV